MSLGPNIGLPETLQQAQLLREANDAYKKETETANFGEKSESFMKGFNMSEFDPSREKDAQARIAALKAQDDPDDIDIDDAYESNSDISNKGVDVGEKDKPSIEAPLEGNEGPKKIPSGEYSALFEKFKNEGHILPRDALTLQNAEITSDNYEIIVGALDIPENTKKHVSECIAHLNSPERVKEAKGELHEYFSDVFDGYFTKTEGDITWNSSFQEEAFEKIAQHYMGGSTKTIIERGEDFDIALTMAAEDLGKRAKIGLTLENIELHKVNFNNALNPKLSRKVRFQSLANLSEVINHVEGVKGKGKLNMQNRLKLGKEKLIAAGKLEQIESQIISLRNKEKDTDQKASQKLEQKIHSELLEAGLSSGEATALIGGELDMMGENSPDNSQEQA